MSETRRVFIVVKTYPTISRKYDELVCTAGILDDGSWVRIYPFPFRKLDYEQRYKKYQWIRLYSSNWANPSASGSRSASVAGARGLGCPASNNARSKAQQNAQGRAA